jgi:indolepyruvate ferredoxin oxidoreductase
LAFHFAPPALANPHDAPRKRKFGGWMMGLLGLLAACRFLRGTRLDPFGSSPDRKLERGLISEYEAMFDRVLPALCPANLSVAAELAAIPSRIRGFGPVKTRYVAQARLGVARLEKRLFAVAHKL